jgi:hypothetical protein
MKKHPSCDRICLQIRREMNEADATDQNRTRFSHRLLEAYAMRFRERV